MGTTLFAAIKFHLNAAYPVVTFVLICIVPFVFEKKIKNWFTIPIILGFDDLAFRISEAGYNVSDKKNKIIPWDEIKSYKFYFSATKNTNLTIYLKNGKSYSYSFKENSTSNDPSMVNDVRTLFISFISKYNLHKDEQSKIKLARGFLITPIGTFTLYSIGALIILVIIVLIFKSPKSSILSFMMGFFIYLQLLYKRKQDKEAFEKMQSEDILTESHGE